MKGPVGQVVTCLAPQCFPKKKRLSDTIKGCNYLNFNRFLNMHFLFEAMETVYLV